MQVTRSSVDCLEQLLSLRSPDLALDPLREKSRALVSKLRFPNAKDEAVSYLPWDLFSLPSLLGSRKNICPDTIERHVLPECKSSYLVFVNGYYEKELSSIPSDCICLSLEDAFKSYGVFLQNRINRALKEETDPFVLINGAIYGRGLFLYVPPEICVKTPVQVIHLITDSSLVAKRFHLILGKSSSLELIQTTIAEEKGAVAMDLTYMDLDRGAKLNGCTVLESAESNWLFHAERPSLKQSASWNSFTFTEGSIAVRQSTEISLLEERAEATVKGLCIEKEKRSSHVQIKAEHLAPNCVSRQHFKSVLRDESRSSFTGEIYVHPIAQKTEAYQLNQNLILSDQAFAASKPNLQIFADDVKASHGAVFSQLNEEELFYLRSRGFSSQGAKQLLVNGFIREMLEEIFVPSLRACLCKRSLV